MRWLGVVLMLVSCSKATREEHALLTKIDVIFQNPTSIEEVVQQVGEFEERYPVTSWGFGYERMHLRVALPITCIIVLANVEGKLAGWQVRCRTTAERWQVIKQEVLQRHPSFKPINDPKDDAQIIITHRREELYRRRDAERARALGPMRPVEVPAALREKYDFLTDEFWTSNVGQDDCSSAVRYAHEFATAGRYDLLSNVLRGPNPGGRAGAALELLEHGADDEDRATIRALKDAPVRTCDFMQKDHKLATALAAAAFNLPCDAPWPHGSRNAIFQLVADPPDLYYAMYRATVCGLRSKSINPSGSGHVNAQRLTLTLREIVYDSATIVATFGAREHVCRAEGTSEEDAVRKATACAIDAVATAWPAPSAKPE